MENKYLQVRKDNIFTKFINFFKKVFYKEKLNIQESDVNAETINSKDDFLSEIKLHREEDANLIKLQTQFENKEIELSSLTDEKIYSLNLLYKRQITDLKKELDHKKTELSIMKNRINNYSTNM